MLVRNDNLGCNNIGFINLNDGGNVKMFIRPNVHAVANRLPHSTVQSWLKSFLN